jgi:calcineurin-like phosphoesterase family protein
MRYFVSDLHIGHANIISYCNRGFKSVEEMDDYILKEFNSILRPDDVLFILGDISLNHDTAVKFLSGLSCNKIVISGNHDRTFLKKGRNETEKRSKAVESFKKAGVSEVHQEARLTLKNGTEILLSHFPYASSADPESVRNYNDRPEDKGLFLLHGHMHCYYLKKGRMIDVGFDNIYRPYSEDEIIEIIKDNRNFIPSRITDFYKTNALKKNPEY